MLLEIDKNVSGYTYKIIEEINKNNREIGNFKGKDEDKQKENRVQYFITASSFPKKMDKIEYT